MKTYIIHYTPLKERKIFMIAQIKKHNLDAEFIEKYDRESLTSNDIFRYNKDKLSMGLISLINKHFYTYKIILQNNSNINLILEDDAILDDKFNIILENALIELPADYDMLFIGNGCNLHIPKKLIKNDKLIYHKCNESTNWGGNGATRCTDSYLISIKCCKKLLDYYEKIEENSINCGPDFLLNDIIRKLNLNIYWLEPTIVKQGSEVGLFKQNY